MKEKNKERHIYLHHLMELDHHPETHLKSKGD